MRFLALLSVFTLAVTGHATALTDVQIKDGLIVNRNTAERVYANVRVTTNYQQYSLYDAELNEIPRTSPFEFGVLLLPGQSRPVGIGAIMLVQRLGPPQPDDKVTFTYTVVGAYYPEPNLKFPDDHPGQGLCFIILEMPAAMSAVCGGAIPSGPFRYVRAINLHPTKSAVLKYKYSTPGKTPKVTAHVPPLQTQPIACADLWGNISELEFKFEQ